MPAESHSSSRPFYYPSSETGRHSGSRSPCRHSHPHDAGTGSNSSVPPLTQVEGQPASEGCQYSDEEGDEDAMLEQTPDRTFIAYSNTLSGCLVCLLLLFRRTRQVYCRQCQLSHLLRVCRESRTLFSRQCRGFKQHGSRARISLSRMPQRRICRRWRTTSIICELP